MQPSIKIVVTLLVIALIAVIGMIFLSGDSSKDVAVTTTANEAQVVQTTEIPAQSEANPQQTADNEPADEAKTSEVSETTEAPDENAAQEEVMYEGALAGLSEEEIAKLALAEEQGAARSETTTGAEDAVD